MRVRYQMIGSRTYQAECDLTAGKAKALYKKLGENGLCEWAELVGEDDDDYMEIIDSFDHIKQARMIASIIGKI